MADQIIWCLLIDYDTSPIENLFDVKADNISSLTRAVKEARSNKLRDIPASRLTVWQCKSSRLSADVEVEDLEEFIATIDFSNKDNVFRVPAGKKLVDLGLAENEILLVEVPCSSSFLSLVLLISF